MLHKNLLPLNKGLKTLFCSAGLNVTLNSNLTIFEEAVLLFLQ